MKFLSAKKKENAPAPSSSTHYLRHEAPRRPLDALPVERDAPVRPSKHVSKSRNASPSRGPYPFSRSFFSQSTPSIARVFHSHDAHVPPPPVPPLPREGIVTSTASPSFFSLRRRPRVDSSQREREASASKPDLSAPTTRPTRPRTRSFGAYLSLGSSASGVGKRGAHAAAPHDAHAHAPELPPLPPVSALQIFDDGGRLHRPHAHGEPLSPRTPRKKRLWTPVKAASASPLPPPAMRPQTARAASEPPPEILVTPRRDVQPQSQTSPRRTSPVPVLDGVWQGFLAEIEEDVSCMDLHGALKAQLELDWPCGSSPARVGAAHLRATPTRATSESALPYLLRTPTASSTTICPPPQHQQSHPNPNQNGSPGMRRSPMKRCVTESDAEHLLTRTASNFSLSLFPLPPAGAPEPLPCHPGAFIPSRPAPRPPSARTLAPPPRERHTTPPKALFAPHPHPNPPPPPPRPPRRPQTASSTSSSSSAWDDLFDSADSESARTGRCSSRATSVSQHHHTHSHSQSTSHSHHREKPSTCDFFSVGAAEVKWGYAV